MEKRTEKKVLFFDIDGTLIDNGKGVCDIPTGVKRAFKRLQEAGHRLMISSGRPKAMLHEKILEAGFDGYVLANGGYVEIDGESIYEERMDYDALKKVIALLKEMGCDYMWKRQSTSIWTRLFMGYMTFLHDTGIRISLYGALTRTAF